MRFLKLTVLLLLSSSLTFAYDRSEAKEGVLDLRAWNFAEKPVLTLDGEWEFYWSKLLDLEDLQKIKNKTFINVHQSWNSIYKQKDYPPLGFATYRLKVLLPKNFNQELAFKMLTVGTAYKLYIDKNLIYTVGKVAKVKEKARAKYFPFVITLGACPHDQISIIFQVSNYHHRRGGLWEPIRFGIEEDILEERENALIFSLFLFGSIFIMFLYHVGLFVLLPRDKSTLYFGLCCFLAAFRILVTNEYILSKVDWLSWDGLLRIEYSTLFISPLTFALFIQAIFPKDMSKVVIKIIWLIAPLLTFLSLTLPSYYASFLVIPFQYFVISLGLYGFGVVLRAFLKKRTSSSIFLIGISALVFTIINDVLYTEDLINTGSWGAYGFLVFIFSQAFLLSQRFSTAYKNSERLTLDLDKAKRLLEEKVLERTASLTDANQALAEKQDKLKELNQELEGFVNIVAHDLKAPLNKVIGLSEIIRLTGKLNNEQKQNLELIREVCAGGENLIQDLLDIGAFEQDSKQASVEDINLSEFLEAFAKSYEQVAKKKRIEIKLDIEPALRLSTEKSYLSRILDNLLSNAIKFSYENSSIWLKAFKEKDEIVLIVKDEGQGLTEEDQQKMFKKFQKLSARPTAGESSNGLGLSIVKVLVEKLQGEIEVKSRQGQGSEFVLRFN